MTKLLALAIDRVQGLPPNPQDEIARVVLTLAGDEETQYRLNPEERAEIAAADAEIARGELATEPEFDKLWTRPIL